MTNALVFVRSNLLIHATSRWERFVAILVAALCSLPRHADLALGLQEEDGSRGKPILGRHGGDALHLKRRERLRPGRVLQRCLPQHDRLLLPLRNRHHGIWNGLSVEESIIAGIEKGCTLKWRIHSSIRVVRAVSLLAVASLDKRT